LTGFSYYIDRHTGILLAFKIIENAPVTGEMFGSEKKAVNLIAGIIQDNTGIAHLSTPAFLLQRTRDIAFLP